MLKNSQIDKKENEVITNAIVNDEKKSFWKNPGFVSSALVSIVSAVLASPVLVTYMSAKTEPVNTKPDRTAVIEPERRETERTEEYRSGGRGRGNRGPYTATASVGANLFGEPDPTKKVLVKLAQGAQVRVLYCRRSSVVVDDRQGRWCKGVYKDDTGQGLKGWVFNAYLYKDSEES